MSFAFCWGAIPGRSAGRNCPPPPCRRKCRRVCRPRCWNAARTCAQTEQLLRSANAQVGESVAEFFPKIGLTAFLGKISPELSAFTLGGANAWGVAAEGTGPLFEGGRLVGQYRQSQGGPGGSPAALPANRPQRLSRSVRCLDVARTAGGNSLGASPRSGDVGPGGAGFHGAVSCRQGQLLRGARSAATALPRGVGFGPHPARRNGWPWSPSTKPLAEAGKTSPTGGAALTGNPAVDHRNQE